MLGIRIANSARQIQWQSSPGYLNDKVHLTLVLRCSRNGVHLHVESRDVRARTSALRAAGGFSSSRKRRK